MTTPEIPAEFTHKALHRMERGGCGDVAFYVMGPLVKGDPAVAARANAKDGSLIAPDGPILCTSCGADVSWSSMSLEVKPRG